MCLFKHNEDAYKEMAQYLDTKNRALLVLGTSGGKTTTALEYVYQNNGRALVLCPTNGIKIDWEAKDVCDAYTYQAFSFNDFYKTIDYSKYCVVILDESHHVGYDEKTDTGAKSWSKSVKWILDNNKCKVLGLTATNERTDGIDLAKTFFDGCTVYGLAVEDMIEQGILYPFSYVTAIYNYHDIVSKFTDLHDTEDKTAKDLLGQLDLSINNTKTVKTILNEYVKKQGIKKIKGIVFVSANNKKSEQNTLDEAKSIILNSFPYMEDKVRILYSNDSYMKEQGNTCEENKAWFENSEEGIIITINQAGEGWHPKGINVLIMFRKTNSYLVFTQQLGRVMTLKTNNSVDPHAIVFDLVNNIENIEYSVMDTTEKEVEERPICKIIRALEKINSNQIIIADETRDIVECIKKIKEYTEYHYLAPEEILIIKDNYEKIGPKGCCELIDKWWLKSFPNSLKEGEHHRTISSIQNYARRYLNLIYQFSKIYQIDINSYKIINSFDKVSDVKQKLDLKTYSSIFQALNNKIYSAYGYLWCYQDEYYEGWRPSIEKPSKHEQVYCYNNKRCFLSAKQAGEELNLNVSKIHRCCKKLLKHTGGYQFCYLKDIDTYVFDEDLQYIGSKGYSEEEISFLNENIPSKGIKYCAEKLNRTEGSITQFVYRNLSVRPNLSKGKKVRCVELDEIFDSIKEASEYISSQNGCDVISMQCSISKNLKGKNKTAGGYHWEYVG